MAVKIDLRMARGKYLSLQGMLYCVKRRWYEIPYLLDSLYRKRIERAVMGEDRRNVRR